MPGRRSNVPAHAYEDMGATFAAAADRADRFTMTNRERMFALWQAAQYVTRAQIPGDVVECGVWRAGSAMVAALALLDAGQPRPLWLYDTFEGMTAPTDDDRRFDGASAAELMAGEAREAGVLNIWAYATLDDVRQQMATVDYPPELIRYVVGRVEDTLPAQRPPAIAVLRLDTDWYASTRHELEHLWPRLSTGGVLIVDDYGFFEGSRKAVDEYFAEQDLEVLLQRVDFTARMVIKP